MLRLDTGGLLLGVRPTEQYVRSAFPLEPRDRLLIYTDGLLEAVNGQGEAFGDKRLAEFISMHQDLPTEQFAQRLLNEVLAWPRNRSTRAQDDDITAVVIDIL